MAGVPESRPEHRSICLAQDPPFNLPYTATSSACINMGREAQALYKRPNKGPDAGTMVHPKVSEWLGWRPPSNCENPYGLMADQTCP